MVAIAIHWSVHTRAALFTANWPQLPGEMSNGDTSR